MATITADLPTLFGVTSGIAVLAGLICMVLHLFSKTKYPRPRHFGDANLAPPILFSSDTGTVYPRVSSGRRCRSRLSFSLFPSHSLSLSHTSFLSHVVPVLAIFIISSVSDRSVPLAFKPSPLIRNGFYFFRWHSFFRLSACLANSPRPWTGHGSAGGAFFGSISGGTTTVCSSGPGTGSCFLAVVF